MASNYQEFVTTVKLNSEDAKNKLEQLRKDTERWIKERDQLILTAWILPRWNNCNRQRRC